MSDNYNNPYAPRGRDQPPARDPYQQGGYNTQSTYTPPQSGYETYRPPTDDYRSSPTSPNMQVAPYDSDRQRRSGDYGRTNRSRYSPDNEDRYSDRPSYGDRLDPRSHTSSRPGSRGSHKEKRDSEVKSLGATIAGGIAGALIGRKAGNKDILPTVIGGVAGAWGGHKLEEEIEKKRSRSRRRSGEPEVGYYGRGRRNSDDDDKKSFTEKLKDRVRSLSRKGGDRDKDRNRSSSRSRKARGRNESESDESDYDDRYDKRRSGGGGRNARYGSESREQYYGRDRDRDDRY